MKKKIYFAGCSITAGNELWEEAHIPNYSSMSFKEAKRVMEDIDDSMAVEYNRNNAFPAIVGKELGVETFNLGFSGISNKELALRMLSFFKEEKYEDTMLVMQLTTHNRMLLKYKEEKDLLTFGSFVVMPGADDHRLTRNQNNLLKEMFFEFMPESLIVADDHVFFYYVAEVLKNKGIPVYILWTDIEIVDWANWDIVGGHDSSKKFNIINDKDPQWTGDVSKHFTDRHHNFNLLGTTMQKIAGEFSSSRLPRLHFKKTAHETIAKAILEKLKCLVG